MKIKDQQTTLTGPIVLARHAKIAEGNRQPVRALLDMHKIT